MTAPFNNNTALDNNEEVIRANNREAGETTPQALPMPWHELNADEKTVCLWYVHNTLSYFDKAAVARHIIGCEILANEAAGVKPTITKERADEIWATVFKN